jgi:hypothetical protein
VAELLFPSPL